MQDEHNASFYFNKMCRPLSAWSPHNGEIRCKYKMNLRFSQRKASKNAGGRTKSIKITFLREENEKNGGSEKTQKHRVVPFYVLTFSRKKPLCYGQRGYAKNRDFCERCSLPSTWYTHEGDYSVKEQTSKNLIFRWQCKNQPFFDFSLKKG